MACSMLMVATLFPVATGGAAAEVAAELGAAGRSPVPVWATLRDAARKQPIARMRANMLVIMLL
jgi:hypothetical protein